MNYIMDLTADSRTLLETFKTVVLLARDPDQVQLIAQNTYSVNFLITPPPGADPDALKFGLENGFEYDGIQGDVEVQPDGKWKVTVTWSVGDDDQADALACALPHAVSESIDVQGSPADHDAAVQTILAEWGIQAIRGQWGDWDVPAPAPVTG